MGAPVLKCERTTVVVPRARGKKLEAKVWHSWQCNACCSALGSFSQQLRFAMQSESCVWGGNRGDDDRRRRLEELDMLKLGHVNINILLRSRYKGGAPPNVPLFTTICRSEQSNYRQPNPLKLSEQPAAVLAFTTRPAQQQKCTSIIKDP